MVNAREEEPPSPAEVKHLHATRLRWWREVLYIAIFYGIYTWTRNQFGSASVDSTIAHNHALWIISAEKAIGFFIEPGFQQHFLGWKFFIQFWNVFYGTFHFVVTGGVLAWLFARYRHDYSVWRNTLAFTTALALVGFSLFPLMPPRLLSADDDEFGAGHGNPHFQDDYGFVDTLAEYGGLWSFNEGAMAKVSNQYAAMPSLHFAWSSWCVAGTWGRIRRRWLRALTLLYPAATLFAIVVTANHFWLDAVGGAIVLGVGWYLGNKFTDWTERRILAQTTV